MANGLTANPLQPNIKRNHAQYKWTKKQKNDSGLETFRGRLHPQSKSNTFVDSFIQSSLKEEDEYPAKKKRNTGLDK